VFMLFYFQALCREAVVWRELRHDSLLSFIGLDAVTFSPFLSMVSPWMHHGTILGHLTKSSKDTIESWVRRSSVVRTPHQHNSF
jgi:hypothetical protein